VENLSKGKNSKYVMLMQRSIFLIKLSAHGARLVMLTIWNRVKAEIGNADHPKKVPGYFSAITPPHA